jgi:hypothetical protein
MHFAEGFVKRTTEDFRRVLSARATASRLKKAHPGMDVIMPAVPRITAREAAEDFVQPLRHNTMNSRRKNLGLSQSELAAVLDVDATSIYRHERGEVLPSLWDYALRGVEAETVNPTVRRMLRDFKSRLARPNVFVQGYGARGYRFIAVRMVSELRGHARADRLKRKVRPAERKAGKAVVVDLPNRRSSSDAPSD